MKRVVSAGFESLKLNISRSRDSLTAPALHQRNCLWLWASLSSFWSYPYLFSVHWSCNFLQASSFRLYIMWLVEQRAGPAWLSAFSRIRALRLHAPWFFLRPGAI